MKYLVLVLFLPYMISCKSADNDLAAGEQKVDSLAMANTLNALTIEEIDTIKIQPTSIGAYVKMTNYAIELMGDTSNSENSAKGEVLLSVLATHLKDQIENKSLNPDKKLTKSLLEKYAQNKYLIHQPKVSNVLKLAHHACDGNFKYIYSRIKHNRCFIPALVFLGLTLTFSLLNIFRLIRWKYRRGCNVFILVVVALILVTAIIFNKTCDKKVTQTTFYGIRF